MLEQVTIILMAKFPAAGRVKTRLSPAFSPESAAEIYRAFLLHFAKRLNALRPAELVVCFDPPDCGAAMRELLGPEIAATYRPQASGDLGDRLCAAARSAHELHRRVLFLGVDSPDVPDEHLHRAAAMTNQVPITLGPTDDGGFWCLGLSGDVDAEALLCGVEFSSGREARQIIDRAHALSYAIAMAPQWDDVDRAADLERLILRLESSTRSEDRALLEQLRDAEACHERI